MDRDSLIAQIQREQDLDRASTLVELLKVVDEEKRNRRTFWSTPLMLAVAGGIVSVLGGIVIGAIEHFSRLELERQQSINELVLEAVASDPETSRSNLNFLADAGLLGELGDAITAAAVENAPINEEKARTPVEAEPTTPTAVFFGTYGVLENARGELADLKQRPQLATANLQIMYREARDEFSVYVDLESRQAARLLIRELGAEVPTLMRTVAATCASLEVNRDAVGGTGDVLFCAAPEAN